jgi:hypothetical protein
MAPWTTDFTNHTPGTSAAITTKNERYTDGTSAYYELLEADADVSLNPAYEALDFGVGTGLGAFDAVIVMPAVDLDVDDLFSVHLDSLDVSNGAAPDANDILFMVNSTAATGLWTHLANLTSEAVDYGAYEGKGTTGEDNIKADFVRHISYKVTGGYASVDIFANELEMKNEIGSKVGAAVTSLKSKWDALDTGGSFEAYDPDGGNILVELARHKYTWEVAKSKTVMIAEGTTKSLYEFASEHSDIFPILSKFWNELSANTASDATDLSVNFTIGGSTPSYDLDAYTVGQATAKMTDNLVFHVNVSVTDESQLPDNRLVNSLVTQRVYKVVVPISND